MNTLKRWLVRPYVLRELPGSALCVRNPDRGIPERLILAGRTTPEDPWQASRLRDGTLSGPVVRAGDLFSWQIL